MSDPVIDSDPPASVSPHGRLIAQWSWTGPTDIFSEDPPRHDRAEFRMDEDGNTTMLVRGHGFTWTPEALEQLRRILTDLSVRAAAARG